MGLIKLHKYQDTASQSIQEFWTDMLDALNNKKFSKHITPEQRKKLLSAPTGAGKTVIASDAISKTAEQWKKDGVEAVFFVVAPNSLNHQLKSDMTRNGVGSNGILNPISIQSVAEGQKIKPFDIVFTNYASINKKNNTVIVENERETDLKTQVERLKSNGVHVILVVDEAHFGYSAKSSQDFINSVLSPDLTLLITATPHNKIYGYSNPEKQTIVVDKDEVISQGSLVKKVILNKGIDQVSTNDSDDEYRVANLVFVDMAIVMKEQMDKAYKEAGSNVRCLLGIQIPSKSRNVFEMNEDSGERRKDNEDEKGMLQYVLDHLEKKRPDWYVTDTPDGKGDVDDKVAIWLAEQKTHNAADDIIKPNNSHVDVIIFKEAIAVGWDCPRLGAGAMLRDSKTKPFITQTAGRFTRMPEQKHYDNELLNHAYLYTAYELMHKIITDGNDGMIGLETQIESALRFDDVETQSIIKAVSSNGKIPYDHRQRNNTPVINKDSIEDAVDEYLQELNIEKIQLGHEYYGISKEDWELLGIEFNVVDAGVTVLDEQELYLDTLENVEYRTINSGIKKSDSEKEKDFEYLIQSVATHGSLKLAKTANNLRKVLKYRFLPVVVVRKLPVPEMDFIKTILATESNTLAFMNVVENVLQKAAAIQGDSARVDVIKRSEEPWKIPNTLYIHKDKVLSDEQYAEDVLAESLHESVEKPSSRAEEAYLDTVPKAIREKITKRYNNQMKHRFMKNGEQGSHFGIKYEDSRGEHIFYPDFMHFFLDINGLHVAIIEVKEQGSQKGDTPETLKAKAKALEKYAEEMRGKGVSVHGKIWAFSPDGKTVTVVTEDKSKDVTTTVEKTVENLLEEIVQQD